MDACDVVIIGGGPGGSSCAWSLGRAGYDVVVVDKAVFPRDKVCAGWITPQVLDELQIDADDYRDGRTFQPITRFRVGLIGDEELVEASYDRPVSFGIRRCEFDHYLLRRSGARVRLGAPVSTIRRDGGQWIVNERVKAPMLVGAGGHFCPVARMLNRGANPATLVGAQEVELAIEGRACAITGEMPELYFCTDLRGYGWCFRKGDYVNIGFGRVDPRGLPKATSEFLAFLVTTRRVSPHPSWHWRGHAYLLAGTSRRHPVDDAVLLVGDAAGLAYPQSGEGIRPAVESGLMAASTIVRANGRYTSDRLQPYARRLAQRYGQHPLVHRLSRIVPQQIPALLTPRLLDTPWFVRHVVLERWFLHAREEAVGAAG